MLHDHTSTRRRFLQRATLSAGALFLAALGGCKPQGEAANGGSTTPASGNATGATGNATTVSVGRAKPYTGEDVLLGQFASLSGDTATFGQSSDSAIQLAIEQQNAKGGLLGRKVRIETVDTASQTQQVPAVVLKLINNFNVLAIIGEVASSRSIAAAPIAQDAGVPMLSPSSTNPQVTKRGDYIFRSAYTDDYIGKVVSQIAREDFKAKTAAIMTAENSDYSKGLTQYFAEDFEKNGGKVVSRQSYQEGSDTDFRAQLTQIKGANPDILFVPGYYTDAGAIAKQARAQGLKAQLMGCDGWDSPRLTEIGGQAVQGAYFTDHYAPDSPEPRAKAFVAAYQKKYGKRPDALAACAYDAANIMMDAIKRASEDGKTIPDRQAIRDALATTKNFPGVTGQITMDANRNASKPVVLLQVKGDKFELVRTIPPPK